ncbi:hypothetical protein [Pedobacter foliorum]|uniref:hypothetical protein n=1 Tax=Pedobacter foliorum TaxID=2739058 RepID=UPI00156428A0|nr:hypothetical protein [Pedobacter foliorum]NRF38560.1 hypothetical protein [Pedobacter foliorum]
MKLNFRKMTWGYRVSSYIILLVIGTFLVYFPILDNRFLMNWDDQWVVVNRYTEGGVNFENISAIFLEFYSSQYAPFNELFYLFLYRFFGYDSYVFHFACLVIHIINIILIFFISIKLLRNVSAIKADHALIISFLISLYFGIHPFNVEAVSWISASKVLIYATFYLLATISYISYLERKELKHYLLTALFFTCSFFGKEQAVIFPLWMMVLNLMYGYQFFEWKTWRGVIPFFVLSLSFGILTMLSQLEAGYGVLSKEATYPIWQRFFLGSYAYFEYLLKIVFPFKLYYLYPFPSNVGSPLPNWILIYPLLICVIGFSFWKVIKSPPFFIGIAIFTLHILLALHIIPLSRHAVVADRYAYISSIGIGFIIFYYLYLLYGRSNHYIKKSLLVGVILFLIYLGKYSHTRTYEWHDSESVKNRITHLLKKDLANLSAS